MPELEETWLSEIAYRPKQPQVQPLSSALASLLGRCPPLEKLSDALPELRFCRYSVIPIIYFFKKVLCLFIW